MLLPLKKEVKRAHNPLQNSRDWIDEFEIVDAELMSCRG